MRYEDAERARGQETEEIEAEIANLDTAVVEADNAREHADELIDVKDHAVRDILRAALRDKTRELEDARRRLRDLRAHRETLAKPSVTRRLKALE